VKRLLFVMMFLSILAGKVNSIDKSELANILKIVINLPELQEYYHIDILPERKPLIIVADEFIQYDLKIKKFGEPIIFMDKAEIKRKSIKAYLEIMNFEMVNNIAKITLNYSIEGLIIDVILIKENGFWKVKESKLIEK